MRSVIRAYSPIKKQYIIDQNKAHAWMEKKDHNEEIRDTLKDIHGHTSSAIPSHTSSILSSPSKKQKQKQKQTQYVLPKPSVDSFMTSPVVVKKPKKVPNARERERHNTSTEIGPDSSEVEESEYS